MDLLTYVPYPLENVGRDIPAFLKQYPEEAGTSQPPLNNKTRKVGADYHRVPLLLRKSVKRPFNLFS